MPLHTPGGSAELARTRRESRAKVGGTAVRAGPALGRGPCWEAAGRGKEILSAGEGRRGGYPKGGGRDSEKWGDKERPHNMKTVSQFTKGS